jgi:hypothetical protein
MSAVVSLCTGEQTRYRIGDQMFTDLPSLLNFYKVIFLNLFASDMRRGLIAACLGIFLKIGP